MLTKREAFEAIKQAILTMGIDRQDIVEFCNKELTLLDKRASKDSKAKQEKAEERIKIGEQILAVLAKAEENMTTTEIAFNLGISPQKATAVLKELKALGKVEVEQIKRRNVYAYKAD